MNISKIELSAFCEYYVVLVCELYLFCQMWTLYAWTFFFVFEPFTYVNMVDCTRIEYFCGFCRLIRNIGFLINVGLVWQRLFRGVILPCLGYHIVTQRTAGEQWKVICRRYLMERLLWELVAVRMLIGYIRVTEQPNNNLITT